MTECPIKYTAAVASPHWVWDISAMFTWDQKLFFFMNTTMTNPLFDWIMPRVTDLHKNKAFLLFFVPSLLAFWFLKKRRKAIPVFLGLVLTVAIVDPLVYRGLKQNIKRERPPAIETEIQLRTDRYGGYSFPSNHAANNFAGATFLSACYPALSPVFFGIAGLIAFSRVYVGVHYPLDILAGALFGYVFGLLFFKLWVIILARLPKKWKLELES